MAKDRDREILISCDLARFYSLLERLREGVGGGRRLSSCVGRMVWPSRGVYFFFEDGEVRNINEKRVVRVGTHAVSLGAKSTLWGRLRTHRGGVFGGGNHRGSVFRLHVGDAIMRKHPDLFVDTWGRGSTASLEVRQRERVLENAVSCFLGEMHLLWVGIEDSSSVLSLRSYIERNSIALLSNEYCHSMASPEWLGKYSPRVAICDSGLWNIKWVGSEYDNDFLNVFEKCIDRFIACL